MTVKRISPAEALELLRNEGYAYLDVRSIPEFDAGHPEGAYNVPLAQAGPRGMAANPDFVSVIKAHFDKDAKLILGCKTGVRSLRAAQMLLLEGYTDVIDQRAGYLGAMDPFGRVVEQGWQPAGLPVSRTPEPGRSWADLSAKKA